MLQATISISLSFMLFLLFLLALFQITFMSHVLNICCCISSSMCFFALSLCIYYIFVFIVCVNVSYFVSVYVSMCDRI